MANQSSRLYRRWKSFPLSKPNSIYHLHGGASRLDLTVIEILFGSNSLGLEAEICRLTAELDIVSISMVESFVGTDITMSDEIGEHSNHLDKEADLTMGEKAIDIMNEGAGMAWMFSFMGKKLWKRKKHEGKISPSSSRMMRTISIHHLECTDFVSQSEAEETASDSESLKNAQSSDSVAMSGRESKLLKETHESAKGHHSGEAYKVLDAADDLSISHDKLDKVENNLLDKHRVLKGKLVEARDALLKLKDVNPKSMSNDFANQSKLFLDALELFNANREAIFHAHEDPNHSSPDYVERLQDPTKARMLTKSASFPGLEFSASAGGIFLPNYRRMKSASVATRGTKSESVSSFINIMGVGSDLEVLPDSHELRKRREAGTVLNRLRCIKERIRDVLMENRKEKRRISRDGILHKVPFGHKQLEDVRDKRLNLWAERCDGGSEGSNFNNAPCGSYSKFTPKSFQRSISLNESLDRYSHLLKTLSLNEKGEDPENSKTTREDNGLLQGKLPKSLGRMLSSPAFRTYSLSKAVQSQVSPESSQILVAEPFGSKMDRIVRSKSVREDNGLQQEKLPKNFGRMLSSPVFRSYSFSKPVQTERLLESSQIRTPESLGIVMETIVDKPINEAIISPILEKIEREHEIVLDPDSLLSAEEAIRSDKCVTPIESITEMIESQVNQVCADDSESTELSLFTDVMDKEVNLINGHEAQTEAESDVKTEKPSFISSLDLNMVEGGSAKDLLRQDSEQQPEQQHQLSDTQNKIDCNEPNLTEQMKSSFLIHVDHKYDTLFEFLRHILSKSEHGTLLSSPAADAKIDAPFEQNLLYDLINEALVEIYEHSTAPDPWLLRFHSKIRAMPVGNYLLKDVWAEVRWHLLAPQGLDATLDDLMAHDFAKNDGWMNLYREAECVALQLEYLILDDLLDEAVVGSHGFDF